MNQYSFFHFQVSDFKNLSHWKLTFHLEYIKNRKKMTVVHSPYAHWIIEKDLWDSFYHVFVPLDKLKFPKNTNLIALEYEINRSPQFSLWIDKLTLLNDIEFYKTDPPLSEVLSLQDFEAPLFKLNNIISFSSQKPKVHFIRRGRGHALKLEFDPSPHRKLVFIPFGRPQVISPHSNINFWIRVPQQSELMMKIIGMKELKSMENGYAHEINWFRWKINRRDWHGLTLVENFQDLSNPPVGILLEFPKTQRTKIYLDSFTASQADEPKLK